MGVTSRLYQEKLSGNMKLEIVLVSVLVVALVPVIEGLPWYQGDGLADCAPGKCAPTAEVSPIQCSSDPILFFNNGFPTLCAEGEACDEDAAAAGEGNPCRAAGGEDGYSRNGVMGPASGDMAPAGSVLAPTSVVMGPSSGVMGPPSSIPGCAGCEGIPVSWRWRGNNKTTVVKLQ